MTDSHAQQSGFRHTASIPLRFGDFDPFGHVNNVAYFAIVEAARIEFLLKLRERGRFPRTLVGHASINYRLEIKLGTQEIKVTTHVDEVGRSSVRLRHIVNDGTQVFADGESVLVVQTREGTSRPFTDDERANLFGTSTVASDR